MVEKNGRKVCSKSFPKPFTNETIPPDNAWYALSGGIVSLVKGFGKLFEHTFRPFFSTIQTALRVIDDFVCAKLPDPDEDPMLFELVTSYMMHGPCGDLHPNAVCMVDIMAASLCD
jgi:hypothetical protein